jgi:hypothetical protein
LLKGSFTSRVASLSRKPVDLPVHVLVLKIETHQLKATLMIYCKGYKAMNPSICQRDNSRVS